ncbi:hypothetical protein [Rickettsia asiatica]|uniref:hypothetical protein n=1 Tax=Rickettsia asiatica TaxID=238800 RepID=UPI002F9643AB
MNNFFLVCMAEEVFFRGFLTKNITKSFTKTADFSCYYSIFNIWDCTFSRRGIYSFKHYMRFFLWLCIL